MDFERYYQVKILSKQLNFKRNFSTLVPLSSLSSLSSLASLASLSSLSSRASVRLRA